MHANYHTHTMRCKHGRGTPSDFCAAALEQGVDCIGFTDHCPHPDGKWASVRMDLSELDDYFEDIREARRRYPQLEIHAGLECEYRPDLGDYQRDEYLQHPNRCEYLILAIHDFLDAAGEWHSTWRLENQDELRGYAAFAVRAMRTGLYRVLAHPDLFAYTGCGWNAVTEECCRAILETAQDTGIPLELNANGLRKPLCTDADGLLRRKYPYLPFWRLAAEYDVQVIVASDAHTPDVIWGNASDCEAIARFYGLHLVSRLEF